MLIEIHAIQNHSSANLNRDDLGAPKTCYFGGVLRSRISSQCLKRSIRMSREFQQLLGGVRTRQLAKLIADEVGGTAVTRKRVEKILELCGLKPKKDRKADDDETGGSEKSKMLVYTTREAIAEMATLLGRIDSKTDEQLALEFGVLISKHVAVPDMALCGRMLETGVLSNTTVEAALQVMHAFSTHEARPEVDYYVAADDVPGEDAGAGYVDEALFASACFYKYFTIHWETLVANLRGNTALAAHTVGAFLLGAALANPSGKQNSHAAHNRPDGIMVEIRDAPINYANAFAEPACRGERSLVSQSIAMLAQYVHDLDTGYGAPGHRFWFSPNMRYPLEVVDGHQTTPVTAQNFIALDAMVPAIITAIGYNWADVQREVVS